MRKGVNFDFLNENNKCEMEKLYIDKRYEGLCLLII